MQTEGLTAVPGVEVVGVWPPRPAGRGVDGGGQHPHDDAEEVQ